MIHGPTCHEFGIRGYGNPSYGVCVVGIAPGRDEAERTKRPFTGQSGRLLDQLLKFAGWSRERIYASNTICWFNNSPSPHEIEACRPRFVQELRDLSPKLIIAAGTIASEAVLGRKRKPGQRGAVMWSDYWNAYVLDTHHPSFALQAQSMNAAQDIIRDLSKIEMVLGWPPHAEHAKVSYDIVETLGAAQDALTRRVPRDGRIVTLDIETSNPDDEDIDAYVDQLLRFAVSFLDDAGNEKNIVFRDSCFPLCVRDGSHSSAWRSRGNCPKCTLLQFPVIWPSEPRWTFQYGQADIPGLYEYFGNVDGTMLKEDTMLMSVCTDERPKSPGQKGTTGQHGLKQNAREWLGAGWYNETVKPFYKGKLNQVAPEDLDEYNAKDAAYTRRLVSIFMPRMEADGTTGLYRDLLIPATQTFIQMQIRGIKVNQQVLQELAYDNWFPRYLETYKALQEEAKDIGWPTNDINLNSSPQLAKLFYDVLGVDIRKWTPGGKPSVDKEILDQMDHPFAAKLRAYRTLDTMIDYVLSVYNHLKHDGLLHPSAFVSTTRTGRTSYRNPAMQTIPQDYTVGADYARLREIIEAHNPETHEIVSADYNQVEVWMAWAFSKDPVLLEHLQSGDVHTRTAEGAFNTKRELHSPEEWTEYRQRAKHIRFGIQFGEGAVGLTRQPPIGIGGTVADAQKFINNYKRTYPTYTQWMLDIQREAQTKGYLRTPDGRVMRFPVIFDHKQLRQAINFPIQNTASAYNLTSMVELEHPDFNHRLRALNSWVILNIHDNLVIESDRRYRSEVAALIREVMEKPRYPGFPSIKVDLKVGPNLGKVEKLK